MEQQTLSAPIKPNGLSCRQRGWRFFVWPKADVKQEQEISSNHPFAKLFNRIEQEISKKTCEYGIAALNNIDVCFTQGPYKETDNTKSHGGCVPNNEARLQLMIDLTAELLETKPDYFYQLVYHEYCHALFMEALFIAYSSDGVPDYSRKSVNIADEHGRNETVASEALADIFALMMHGKISFVEPADTTLLTYEALLESSRYNDAYSLKLFLISKLREQPEAKDFFYNTLYHRRHHPHWSLMQCLERGYQEDLLLNPSQETLGVAYEQYRLSTLAD